MLDITKQTWTADKGLKELTTAQMTSSQLQTWSHHLQTAVIANKSCYFFSSKLRAYQKSRINVIFNVFSVLLLFVFTVFCFSLLNFSLYKIQPQAYQFVSIKPDFFSFFYYSFNAIHFNSIPEVTTINNLSRSLFLFEQFFALILIGIFFTLFLSIKNEKESADIDEVVNKIKVQGDIMGEYISTEYKMSVDDAIVEVQKLKGALIKVIFYLTKNIT